MLRLVVVMSALLALMGSVTSATEPELTLYGAILETPLQDEESGGVLDDPKRIRILNLGKVVNHSGLDYGPTVSADGKTLYFVSNRKGSRLTRDGDFSHDFWATKKNANLDTIFFTPYNIDTLDAGVNSITNEGVASIAADRQTLFFTGCNRPDGLGDCDIYMAEIQGDRWSRPFNLGRNVNSEYWDSQPTISSDRQILYFVSNRPSPTNPSGEGQDDTDIWFCEWDEDMGEWKAAKNLGPDVNTEKSEVSPFIAADGNTLYFASNGHTPNMGGLDFYVTRKTGQKDREGRARWGAASQLPAPINTAEDEQFISLPASGDVVYFSSRRQDIPGFQGDLDIFMAFIPSYSRAVNIIVNVIDECTGQNVPAMLTYRNNATARQVKDSVSAARSESNVIVTADDYGPNNNRRDTVNFSIVAYSPVYGERAITVDVGDPGKTRDQQKAGQQLEIRRTILMGQRPVLGAEMAPSDWARRTNNPFKGLVIEEKATITLYPLLNYIFFELNSAELSQRYTKFSSSSQTGSFNDERIPGGVFDKYYTVMNIYGYRLKKYPNVKVTLTGCVDENNEDKKSDLPRKRAEVVYNYLRDIWGIEESRMKIVTRGWPEVRSNPKDSFGIVENRRTEITFDGDAEEVWQVARPILDNDPTPVPTPETMTWTMQNGIDSTLVASRRIEVFNNNLAWNTLNNVGSFEATNEWNWQNTDAEYPIEQTPYKAVLVVVSKNGTECKSDTVTIPVKRISSKERMIVRGADKTLEKYNLILFPFDRFDAGPFNERILRDYVYDRVKPNSEVKVEGHTDVVGMFDHNKRLSENRARTTKDLINGKTKGAYKSLETRGTGEEEPLYTNELPEGRFFNRTVQVQIETPIEAEQNP
jgi:outer membrane protein OmpA-like peptidoglycan-associated protein